MDWIIGFSSPECQHGKHRMKVEALLADNPCSSVGDPHAQLTVGEKELSRMKRRYKIKL